MTSPISATALVTMCLVACTADAGQAGDPGPYVAGSYGDAYGGQVGMPIPPNMTCDTPAPTFEEVTAFAKCVGCHASTQSGTDRKGAPVHVNFDSAAAADMSGDRAVAMIMSGAMPPKSTGMSLTDTEKQRLYDWVLCRM